METLSGPPAGFTWNAMMSRSFEAPIGRTASTSSFFAIAWPMVTSVAVTSLLLIDSGRVATTSSGPF